MLEGVDPLHTHQVMWLYPPIPTIVKSVYFLTNLFSDIFDKSFEPPWWSHYTASTHKSAGSFPGRVLVVTGKRNFHSPSSNLSFLFLFCFPCSENNSVGFAARKLAAAVDAASIINSASRWRFQINTSSRFSRQINSCRQQYSTGPGFTTSCLNNVFSPSLFFMKIKKSL